MSQTVLQGMIVTNAAYTPYGLANIGRSFNQPSCDLGGHSALQHIDRIKPQISMKLLPSFAQGSLGLMLAALMGKLSAIHSLFGVIGHYITTSDKGGKKDPSVNMFSRLNT